jgi:hypothetical protein
MTLAIAVTAAILIGFLAGLLTFRRASHWCPDCGLTLTCPQHGHHTTGSGHRA